MDNPIQELNNKVVELYGKLAKLEYELETLDVKKEAMRKDYGHPPAVSTENKRQSTLKG
jgi:uncharacterized coiled-coil protein SlyX